MHARERDERESGTNKDIILLLLLVQIIQLSKRIRIYDWTLLILYLDALALEIEIVGHRSCYVS
jgi:hypothetical protein